jgi:hypothetical protein
MIRFTAFPEIQLNPGIKDIGDCRWAKPIHRANIIHTYPQGIYRGVGATEHTLDACLSIYLSTRPNYPNLLLRAYQK